MATPGFGFSVGDFISGVSLVHKLIALASMTRLQVVPEQAAQKFVLEQIVVQCEESIKTFINKNSKFRLSLGIQSPPSSYWRSNSHKIQWALCKSNAIETLRTEITAHTMTLNIILSTMCCKIYKI